MWEFSSDLKQWKLGCTIVRGPLSQKLLLPHWCFGFWQEDDALPSLVWLIHHRAKQFLIAKALPSVQIFRL